MFRVSAPLLSRQWTPKQIRFFKKQKLQSAAAQQRKKALRPKYMPSWTRHDIWTDDSQSQAKKTTKTTTQLNTAQTTPSKSTQTLKPDTQAPPQPEQVSTPPPTTEKKEEKKSRFKFW